MSSVNEAQPHVIVLIDLAMRAFRLRMDELGEGHKVLRPSQYRLLTMTPTGGIRQTDLALRAGMSKQALGEFVVALQQAGLYEVAQDPADRRARLIKVTPAGLKVRAEMLEMIITVEREWAGKVGAERFAILRQALAEIGDADAWV